MLSVGRSISETAAVIFTAGSSLRIPTSLMDSTRTMAVHFYILAREGISAENAYGTAATLGNCSTDCKSFRVLDYEPLYRKEKLRNIDEFEISNTGSEYLFPKGQSIKKCLDGYSGE